MVSLLLRYHILICACGRKASVGGVLTGSPSLVGVLYGIDTTVGAAERVAQTAIFISHSLTTLGLNAAGVALESTGAAETIERSFWKGVSNLLPWKEQSEAITRIIDMVNSFVSPLSELSHVDISNSVKRFASLQQSNKLDIRLPDKVDITQTEDLSRCMGYAAAAYGKLAVNFLHHIPQGRYQKDILSELTPGIEPDHIVLQSEEESFYHPGYMLIVDHLKKDIVVSLRGTMNCCDVVTDLTCEHMPCSDFADIPGIIDAKSFQYAEFSSEEIHYAHEGFYRAALNLDVILRPEIYALCEQYPDYSLLLCGHSLGAGVASLLTILWAQQFQHVR